MADVFLKHISETYMEINADIHIVRELSERYTFFADNYQFHPKFKAGMWDGKIRLLDRRTQYLYKGLVEDVVQFCEQEGYTVDLDKGFKYVKDVPSNAGEVVCDRIGTPDHFKPRFYQNDAVATAIQKHRGFLISPTGSGKSFIIYLLTRYYMQKGLRTLIILPSVGLVKQLHEDFEDYLAEGDKLDMHMIAAGADRNTDADITFSTWQSIYKEENEYFDQYDVVIGDEADEFDAKSLKGILEKCHNVKYRFGFTGTLEDCAMDEKVLTGLFGPIKQVTTTAELIEMGILAELNIQALVFEHTLDTKAKAKIKGKKATYAQEMALLEGHERRNKYIRNLANKLEGNTLILFNKIEKHGDVLNKLLEGIDKEVHYVHGKVDADVRNEVRKIVEKSDNCIILGSYGTFSRGINVKRIDNIIFAVSFKSKKRVLQSIGRMLRRGEGSTKSTLYDLVDDLSRGDTQNYSLKHFYERMVIYQKEQFKVKIHKVRLKE